MRLGSCTDQQLSVFRVCVVLILLPIPTDRCRPNTHSRESPCCLCSQRTVDAGVCRGRNYTDLRAFGLKELQLFYIMPAAWANARYFGDMGRFFTSSIHPQWRKVLPRNYSRKLHPSATQTADSSPQQSRPANMCGAAVKPTPGEKNTGPPRAQCILCPVPYRSSQLSVRACTTSCTYTCPFDLKVGRMHIASHMH